MKGIRHAETEEKGWRQNSGENRGRWDSAEASKQWKLNKEREEPANFGNSVKNDSWSSEKNERVLERDWNRSPMKPKERKDDWGPSKPNDGENWKEKMPTNNWNQKPRENDWKNSGPSEDVSGSWSRKPEGSGDGQWNNGGKNETNNWKETKNDEQGWGNFGSDNNWKSGKGDNKSWGNTSGDVVEKSRQSDNSWNHGDADDGKMKNWKQEEAKKNWQKEEAKTNWKGDESKTNWKGDESKNNWKTDESKNNWKSDEPKNNWKNDEPKNNWKSDEQTKSNWKNDEQTKSNWKNETSKPSKWNDQIGDDENHWKSEKTSDKRWGANTEVTSRNVPKDRMENRHEVSNTRDWNRAPNRDDDLNESKPYEGYSKPSTQSTWGDVGRNETQQSGYNEKREIRNNDYNSTQRRNQYRNDDDRNGFRDSDKLWSNHNSNNYRNDYNNEKNYNDSYRARNENTENRRGNDFRGSFMEENPSSQRQWSDNGNNYNNRIDEFADQNEKSWQPYQYQNNSSGGGGGGGYRARASRFGGPSNRFNNRQDMGQDRNDNNGPNRYRNNNNGNMGNRRRNRRDMAPANVGNREVTEDRAQEMKRHEENRRYIPAIETQPSTPIHPGDGFARQQHLDSKLIKIERYGATKDNISVSSFREMELDETLAKNIRDSQYEKPTQIQSATYDIIRKRDDLIATCETGSGKTAAFLIPIIAQLLQSNVNHSTPAALIIVPTRELCNQIFDEARRFARNTSLEIKRCYGGTNTADQKEQLSRGMDILVATPGRLIYFIDQKTINLQDLRYIVIDEGDRLLDVGFFPDIQRIFNAPSMPPKKSVGINKYHATILFSATMPNSIIQQIKEITYHPYKVTVGIQNAPNQDVRQDFKIAMGDKRDTLKRLLEDEKFARMKTIIFVESKRSCDFYGFSVAEWTNGKCISIHGDRTQQQREEALKFFRSDKFLYLVATNVAARGLDIPKVDHVINVDLPPCIEDYVHRIGRTGRCGNIGHSTSLYNPDKPVDFSLKEDLINLFKDSSQDIPPALQSNI
ncbi:hypothetical protein SNEBB_001797 [Seison nebaliae]|nr:hypothetical protein SNEBB_001797 [Seison nebaliae]